MKFIWLVVVTSLYCTAACGENIEFETNLSKAEARQLIEKNCLKCMGADQAKYLEGFYAMEQLSKSTSDIEDLELLSRDYAVMALVHSRDNPKLQDEYFAKQKKTYKRLFELQPTNSKAKLEYIAATKKPEEVKLFLRELMLDEKTFWLGAMQLGQIEFNSGNHKEGITLVERAFESEYVEREDRIQTGLKLKRLYMAMGRDSDAQNVDLQIADRIEN